MERTNQLLCAFGKSSECQRACGKGKNKNIVGKLKKMNAEELWTHVNNQAKSCPIHLGIMVYMRQKHEINEDDLLDKNMYVLDSTEYILADNRETKKSVSNDMKEFSTTTTNKT